MPKSDHPEGSAVGQTPIQLVITGPFPSKKNQLMPRRGRGRGLMYDPKVKTAIERMELEVRAQWGSRDPVRNPAMFFQFFVASVLKDRDGLLTTVLDVLVKARVLENDNIGLFNGWVGLAPARIVPEGNEHCEIVIS